MTVSNSKEPIYSMLSEYANKHNSQLIAASHSEVVLDEAVQKDVVIAFVGKPHRIDDRGSQLRKALVEIGFADYYLAEEKRVVVYLEGSTDLSILQTFARRLSHDE
jgi:L-lactate utilization protein LutC